jgi:hypothetical protein
VISGIVPKMAIRFASFESEYEESSSAGLLPFPTRLGETRGSFEDRKLEKSSSRSVQGVVDRSGREDHLERHFPG